MEVSSADKFDSAFREAMKAGSAALAVTPTGFGGDTIEKKIVELASKNRLPAIYYREDFVESGGLMSYGADLAEPFRGAASISSKTFFKGTKPAELPVEQPKKYEFIVNLRAAKQIG